MRHIAPRMKVESAIIDAAQLRQAIRRIPRVYPPDLEFLSEIPIEQTYVVRQLLLGPVFATPSVPFLAFFSDNDGRRYLSLLVTSDSLSRTIGDDAQDLLSQLYRPPRHVGLWERFTAQFSHRKRQEELLREMKRQGEIDSEMAAAMSKLYIPVLHDDDVFVAFAEDDFTTDDRGPALDRAIKSSGIKRVCSRIQPLRSGLPVSFSNKLFATFRRPANAA